MLFAGFNVSEGNLTLFGDRRGGRAGQPGRLADRLRGRLLRPARAARAKPAHPHQPPHLEWADDGSSATGRRRSSSRGCCRSSAPSSRCPPGSRGCRFWRFTRFTLAGCIPWVLVLAIIGREVGTTGTSGRTTCTTSTTRWSPPIVAAIVYLLIRRGAAGAPSGSRRPPKPTAASPLLTRGRGRPSSAPCRGRPSCCRSRARPTSRSSPGWPAGIGRPRPRARQELRGRAPRGGRGRALIGQRSVIAEELRPFDARRAGGGRPLVPAAGDRSAIGLERPIERRLGGPRATAAGLLAGARGDGRSPTAGRRSRARGRATAADGLALGLAQAAALAPGVSRNGATLSAARWRGFTRQQSNMLSRTVALPVIVGAAVLKGVRLRRRGLPPEARAGVVARRRRLLRLHARLAAADPAGRARPRALAVRRLPRRARRMVLARSWQQRRRGAVIREARAWFPGSGNGAVASGNGSPSWVRPTSSGDGRDRARTRTRGPASARADADAAVEALVRRLARLDAGGSRAGPRQRPLRERPPARRADRDRAVSTDGVGTKLVIAEQLGRWDTVGIDCVAMNVNDVICVGAEPLAMVDYLAVDRADPERRGAIGVGLGARRRARRDRDRRRRARPARRDRQRPGAGGRLLRASWPSTPWSPAPSIEPGDPVIGLPSSGLHSNGYTLARSALG